MQRLWGDLEEIETQNQNIMQGSRGELSRGKEEQKGSPGADAVWLCWSARLYVSPREEEGCRD